MVVGGGAVGIEMVAEIKLVEPALNASLIHSRDRVLSLEPLPDNFKDETLSILRSTGVNVITGQESITFPSEILSDFAKKWRIELLASIFLGNELIHIDTREYDRQIILPIL